MTIPIRRVFLTLVLVTAVLVAIHTAIVLSNHYLVGSPFTSPTVVGMFAVNEEANLPTWWSTVVLFSVAVIAAAVWYQNRGQTKRPFGSQLFWAVVAFAFLYLSADEAARFHEIIDRLTTIKWVYVYAPFGLLFFLYVVFYTMVVNRRDRSRHKWIVIGLLVYGLGGMVCEYIFQKGNLSPALVQLEYIFEEGFEMLGAILVLVGCLQEFNRLTRRPAGVSGDASPKEIPTPPE
jgi:drug/metabolite transporter (DMT)-like permease